MPDSPSASTVTVPIDEVRLLLVVGLSVMPPHVLRALWEPKERRRDAYRAEAVARLTAGWDGWVITRPAAEHDVARLGFAAAASAHAAGAGPGSDAWTMMPVRSMVEAFDDQRGGTDPQFTATPGSNEVGDGSSIVAVPSTT